MTGVEEINGNCYWTATYCDLFVFDHHFITHLQCSSMKAVKKKWKNKINKSPSLPRYFEDNTELKGKLLVLTSVQ